MAFLSVVFSIFDHSGVVDKDHSWYHCGQKSLEVEHAVIGEGVADAGILEKLVSRVHSLQKLARHFGPLHTNQRIAETVTLQNRRRLVGLATF